MRIIQTGRLLLVLLTIWGTPTFSQTIADKKVEEDTNSNQSTSNDIDLDNRPKNNISITILGDGAIASLNYERLFFVSPKNFFIAAGAGAGLNSLISIHSNSGNGTTVSSQQFIVIPHHITGNIGGGSHFFEFGLGGLLLAGDHPKSYLPYLIAGYRLQPRRCNRVHFRLFGSFPLEGIEDYDLLFIPVGLSFGWSF